MSELTVKPRSSFALATSPSPLVLSAVSLFILFSSTLAPASPRHGNKSKALAALADCFRPGTPKPEIQDNATLIAQSSK
jgi:hypothetical protein